MNKLTELIVGLPPLLMVLGGIALMLPAATMFAESASSANPDLLILNYLFWSCMPIGFALGVFTIIASSLKKHRALWLNVVVMSLWVLLCAVFFIRA